MRLLESKLDSSLMEIRTKEFGEEFKQKTILEMKTLGKLSTHTIGRKRQPESRIADSFGFESVRLRVGAEFDFLEDHFVAAIRWEEKRGCVSGIDSWKTFFLPYTDESLEIVRQFIEGSKPS
jgi:hypothetical protein